jgi:hypothetical protein
MANIVCKNWKVVKIEMKKKGVTENVVDVRITAIDNRSSCTRPDGISS